MLNQIAEYLSNHSDLTFDEAQQSLSKVNMQVKLKRGFGDYSIPLKKFGKDRCQSLSETFKAFDVPANHIITNIKVMESKLNIFVDKQRLVKNVLLRIWNAGPHFGKRQINHKKVIVEFSSPNIAKPFHAGHLRSTILGQFLVNLYRFTGHNVIAMNYLGDWGKQFGILGIGLLQADLTVGDLEQLKDPIAKLNEIYVQMNLKIKHEQEEYMETMNIKDKNSAIRLGIVVESKTDKAAKRFFSELENGNPQKRTVWEFIRTVSLKKYQEIYNRLGITFDVYSGESEYGNRYIPSELIEHPSLVTSETLYVDLESEGLGKFVIVKQDGSSLYSLRDITAALDRYQKYSFDEMVYVVASEQDHYFKRLFTVLGLINGDLPGKCRHVSFGLVMGMSTRTGNVILLEAILQKAKAEMKRKINENEQKHKENMIEKGKTYQPRVVNIEQTAAILGKSAIFIQDFKAERTKNYHFEWNRATDFEGQTGPYLQYSHVRLHNILKKAQEKGIELSDLASDFDTRLTEPEALEIVFVVTDFDSVIDKCLKRCEAQPLVSWLFQFVRLVFKAYKTMSVVNCKDPQTAQARLLLFSCCKAVIKNSLLLLGLEPLEKM